MTPFIFLDKCYYRTTVMSCDMESSWGTRNLLFCKWGSEVSWSNRSTITYEWDKTNTSALLLNNILLGARILRRGRSLGQRSTKKWSTWEGEYGQSREKKDDKITPLVVFSSRNIQKWVMLNGKQPRLSTHDTRGTFPGNTNYNWKRKINGQPTGIFDGYFVRIARTSPCRVP